MLTNLKSPAPKRRRKPHPANSLATQPVFNPQTLQSTAPKAKTHSSPSLPKMTKRKSWASRSKVREEVEKEPRRESRGRPRSQQWSGRVRELKLRYRRRRKRRVRVALEIKLLLLSHLLEDNLSRILRWLRLVLWMRQTKIRVLKIQSNKVS